MLTILSAMIHVYNYLDGGEVEESYVDMVSNYGCWCLPSDGVGRGEAVDGIDRACQEYHNCMQAAVFPIARTAIILRPHVLR